MDQLEHLAGDLRFVRGALDTSIRGASPSMLYFLWAAIVLIGFALVDFQSDWVPRYWTVAGPTGFFASAYIGWRHARRLGQASASDGRRHVLHWGAVLSAVALAVLLRGVPSEQLHAVILLVLALGYVTAGLHLDRPLLWVGLLMGAGLVLVTLVSSYAWTAVGIALAVGLTVAGIREGRPREATT